MWIAIWIKNFVPCKQYNLDNFDPDIGDISISGPSNNYDTMNFILMLIVILNNECPA